MNAQKLSKRLETVASFVPTGAVVADIGSDHAYLPCYLVHNGVVTKAIAGEVVKGPFDSALKQVKLEGLEDNITVRLADGLKAIEESDNVDTITIAGMGGPLIVSILEKNPHALKTVTRLILQPNIHAKVIRQWAIRNQWAVLEEVILKEDEKIYEVLVLQRGEMELTEQEILLGKHLIASKTDVFIEKWSKEIDNWKRILTSIERADDTTDIVKKREEVTHKIQLVEEVLNHEES
ncbi:tRNA (adenine(22)-N(1))-methyltransferase [Ureibacillus chungkukjangi]|uniref:tRNA (Adenine22-N1)-methyltransferase n=1 Tax=Ureibacillus chungkukjangi TaxID=1202712 RepID=A0A318TMQ1_9BACL|nr:tRNA (adenine(22)-N(1))-methyltransferase TrmK [Ureibacillus chungkukjangi]PYF04288.1 tRNA (adenine22-N1)-methyltransferase [Ureibacillus chungkukjangi]